MIADTERLRSNVLFIAVTFVFKIINYEILQFSKVIMEGGDEADLNEEEKVPVKVRLENKNCSFASKPKSLLT